MTKVIPANQTCFIKNLTRRKDKVVNLGNQWLATFNERIVAGYSGEPFKLYLSESCLDYDQMSGFELRRLAKYVANKLSHKGYRGYVGGYPNDYHPTMYIVIFPPSWGWFKRWWNRHHSFLAKIVDDCPSFSYKYNEGL